MTRRHATETPCFSVQRRLRNENWSNNRKIERRHVILGYRQGLEQKMPLKENGFIGADIQNWIVKCRERHASLFELATEVNRFSHASVFAFDLRNRTFHETLLFTLCFRVLSNYQAVILLCERGMMPESRIMARAMIEALFLLCAVGRDEKFARDFVKEDQIKRLRFLNKFRKLHGGLPAGVDSQEVLELEAKLKKEIQTDKIRERTTEEWARESGLHSWYLTVYSVLSDSVHTKVRNLERYLQVDEAVAVIKGLQWGPDDSEVKEIMSSAIEGMLIALKSTLPRFQQKGRPSN
jgi:uncharacterized protein DUF5677